MGPFQTIQRAARWLLAPRFRTMFGVARIYSQEQAGRPIRVLDLQGTLQSATYLDEGWCDLPFDYLALYDLAFSAQPHAHDLLMLGGGGYAYPKHIIAHHPEARIDVVEIDPAITDLAQRYFMLDLLEARYHAVETKRLRIIENDACAYLQSCAHDNTRYDAILNDCFTASNDVAELTTPEALNAIKSCLNPGGMYLTNTITAFEGPNSTPLTELVASLSQVFDHIVAVPCCRTRANERDNVMVMASQHDPRIAHAHVLYDCV